MNDRVLSWSVTTLVFGGIVLAFATAQSALGQLAETETSRADAVDEIAGEWYAQFNTAIGIQTYHFNFQVKDEQLTAKAVAEISGQKRDVEFEEAKLDGDTLSFVEMLQYQDREIRIEFTGTLGDKRILFVRKVGNFGGEETEATRNAPQSKPPPLPAPSYDVTIDRVIKDAFKDSFRIGMAGDVPARYSEQELSTASKHFNAITPENCMKPERVHPEENTWRFERPDGLMQWADDNNMSVHGHTLVWHQQTRDWFFRDGDRDTVKRRMKDHIHTLVGRYKGKIHSWDVVNEAINDGGNEETGKTENLRNSKWLQMLGPEYLTLAFQFAHEADPSSILYYNDYGIESGPKHASSMVLLRRLLKNGTPIHAVGIQGHWTTARVPFEDIDKAIADYASLGLKVAITELDVTIRGASGGQFGRGFGRRRVNVAPPSAEDLAAQAEAYAKLFAIFEKHKDVIARVTFWGLNDRRTWRFGQHPLILDGNNNPKPAYAAIVNSNRDLPPSKNGGPDRKTSQRIDRPDWPAAEGLLERYGKRNINVHDPSSIVRCSDEYWMFSTGRLVKSWRSQDLKDWRQGPRVFSKMPQWVTDIVPDQRGHFWAPDVICLDDRYLLYYSVSSFGKNTSAIALASNATLDPDDDDYRWIDHAVVIQTSKEDNYNAIDPAVIHTSSGELWMAFGSHWSGIKLIRLDERTGFRLSEDTHVHALAWNDDIEAARLFEHDGWYYLFLNWGKCCRGIRSTYNIRVGRSKKITGPYLDRNDKQLLQRGGTLLLGTDGPFIGPGHANVFRHGDAFVFHCHFYDATNRGRSRLATMSLSWGSDGWPVVQGPPAVEISQDFIIGADVSWVQAAEDRGVRKPL